MSRSVEDHKRGLVSLDYLEKNADVFIWDYFGHKK